MTLQPEPIRYLIPGLTAWRDIATPGDDQNRDRGELSAHLLSSLQMQNVLVLAGLGTSLDVGGPSMPDLWKLCVGEPPEPIAQRVIEALKYPSWYSLTKRTTFSVGRSAMRRAR